MSYDRKIDQVCPHYVIEEALFINVDHRTVKPVRPIASAPSVMMRVNGVAMVPAYGLHIPAVAMASKQGPFDIQEGVNDQLVVSVNGESAQTITVPAGSRLTAKQVAGYLSRRIHNAVFSATKRRRIRLRSGQEGPAATLIVSSTGSTLASTIGMPTDRVWRGQTIFPGWSLIRDPNTLNDRPTRLVVFDAPFGGAQDYVELSYTTVRQECRRCGGLGVENDWRYNRYGEVVQVRDEALLIQEVTKAVYTIQQSNPFHLWYGSNIVRTVGKKLSSSGLVQNLIVSDINEAFRRWQAIKRKQEEEVGQIVSDEEYPFRMVSLLLEQSQADPTIVFVNATIQNRSRQQIQIERGVKLPQPLDLLGSTAQEGVLRQSLSDYVLTG
jgi:hypothetical protein